MAQFLSPIVEKVQEELNRRQDLTPDGIKDQFGLQNEHGRKGDPHSKNRSPWIRCIPNTTLVDKVSDKIVDKPILMGGVLYQKNNEKTAAGEPITGGIRGGVGINKQYSERDFTGVFTKDVAGAAHRPSPGITGVEVKQKGDLGSLVEITMKWNCFSYEQLGEMSYYYMRPGATATVEFGWSGVEHEPAPHADPDAAMFNKKEWLNPNMEFYAGVITNFEWQGRDDGGFDCTTTLTSGGSLLIQQELKSSQVNATNTAEQNFANLRELFVEENGKKFYKLASRVYYQKGAYGVFATNLKDADGNDNDGYVYCSIGWLEDNVISKLLGFVATGEDKAMEFRSIEFVPTKDGKSGRYMPTRIKFHKDIISTNPYDVFIPNSKLNGTLKLGEHKTDESWGSWFNPFDDNKTWSGVIPEFNWKTYFRPMHERSRWNRTDGSDPTSDWTIAFWRNIVVSSALLKNCARQAETVSEFYQQLFDQINGYCGNVWKFTMLVDDDNTNRVKVLDLNYTDDNIKDIVGQTVTEGVDGIPVKNVYTFPVMQRNSIVKQQSLNMRIPDAAALSAMYGTNSGDAANMTGQGEGNGGSATGGGGGSGQHSDVTMNILACLTSADVGLWAKDEVLKHLQQPGSNFGSRNPYGNIGRGDEKFMQTYTSKQNNNENEGSLAHNDLAPWHLSNDLGGLFGGTKSGGNTNETAESAADATAQNKDKYKDADQASALANCLKSLDDDNKLPAGGFYDKILKEVGKDHDDMKNDPDEGTTKKFIKAVKKAVWSELKRTGGGWIMPTDLRDYWFWIIKYYEDTDSKGSVLDTNFMLPLELELTLDGIGGIQYGNAFQSSFVPEKYLGQTLFQATEVNHSVDNGGWSTTLKGKMRYVDLDTIRATTGDGESVLKKQEDKDKKANQ